MFQFIMLAAEITVAPLGFSQEVNAASQGLENQPRNVVPMVRFLLGTVNAAALDWFFQMEHAALLELNILSMVDAWGSTDI